MKQVAHITVLEIFPLCLNVMVLVSLLTSTRLESKLLVKVSIISVKTADATCFW